MSVAALGPEEQERAGQTVPALLELPAIRTSVHWEGEYTGCWAGVGEGYLYPGQGRTDRTNSFRDSLDLEILLLKSSLL